MLYYLTNIRVGMLMRFHLYICCPFLYNEEFTIFVACYIIIGMFGRKKANKLIEDIDRYFDLMGQSVVVFKEGVRNAYVAASYVELPE